MKRTDVVDWLNYRLELSNSKRSGVIMDRDIAFIRMYINHYKSKLLPPEQIVQSIHHTRNWMGHFDYMVNKLVHDFNIQIDWELAPQSNTFEMFMNGQPVNQGPQMKAKSYSLGPEAATA